MFTAVVSVRRIDWLRRTLGPKGAVNVIKPDDGNHSNVQHPFASSSSSSTTNEHTRLHVLFEIEKFLPQNTDSASVERFQYSSSAVTSVPRRHSS